MIGSNILFTGKLTNESARIDLVVTNKWRLK